MQRRSPALMMLLELIAMLLVFSLCTAVALRMFSQARGMTAYSRHLGAAVDIAQVMAESYRAGGDAEQTAMEYSSEWENDRYRIEYVYGGESYTVYLKPLESEVQISVCYDGSSIYEITVGAV